MSSAGNFILFVEETPVTLKIFHSILEGNMKRAVLKTTVQELKRLKLDTSGSKKVLVKRLNNGQSLAIRNAEGDYPKENIFDFYVIIDFEATCDPQNIIKPEHQEIIEFPAVLLNCKNGKVEDEFQSYCRPVLHPFLTEYCIKLTGITQDIVNQAPSFSKTFASFNKWLQKNNLGSKFSFAIVTDGTKDMGHFLKRQCVLSNILFPEYGKYWINIRKTFSNFYKVGDMQHRARHIDKTVLAVMMMEMGYKFIGRAHSGLDDARNIARIVQGLLKDGASIIFNERLPIESEEEQNGKLTFSLPVLKPEFGILKNTLKSNFPTKNCPANILERSTVNEATIKSCTNSTMLHHEIMVEKTLEPEPAVKYGKTVPELVAKIPSAKKKTAISSALSNISVEDATSKNIATKIVTEEVGAKTNKKSTTIQLKRNVSEGVSAAMNAEKSNNKKKSVKASNKGTPKKFLVNEDTTAATAAKVPEKITTMKSSLKKTPVKIPANEIPIKASEKKPLSQNPTKSVPAKNCTKKIPATAAMNSSPTSSAQCSVQNPKTQEKEFPLITTLENCGKKTRKRRRLKKLPTEAAVKEGDAKKIPDVSESSLQKTAEVLAKELKLAKKKCYGKSQYAAIPIGELKKERKNIEKLKESLNAARLREAQCVPCKPPVEEAVTIAKESNATEKLNTIQASEKAVVHSQKKKASPSKVRNNSEKKDSQESVVRDTKNPLPHKITASLPLDENPHPNCDKAKEELFFQIFENFLDTQTLRDLEGNE